MPRLKLTMTFHQGLEKLMFYISGVLSLSKITKQDSLKMQIRLSFFIASLLTLGAKPVKLLLVKHWPNSLIKKSRIPILVVAKAFIVKLAEVYLR